MSQDTNNGDLHTAISDNVPNCTDDTFDNIFRSVNGGTLQSKNIARVDDKLYGIEPNGSEHNLYSCNLSGTNKTIIKSNINHGNNVYAYNNKIYYYEYGIKDNRFYKVINKYDISTGEVTQFIDFVSKFGQLKGVFNISFYVKDNTMYVTLIDDNGKTTKTYSC